MKDDNRDLSFDDFSFDEEDSDFCAFYGDDDDSDLDIPYDEKEECGPPPPNPPAKRRIEGLTLERAEFEKRTFADFTLAHYEIYNVTFRNCTFRNVVHDSGRFLMCTFENCEFISNMGEGHGWIDCDFNKCRYSGTLYVDDCYFYQDCRHTDCLTDSSISSFKPEYRESTCSVWVGRHGFYNGENEYQEFRNVVLNCSFVDCVFMNSYAEHTDWINCTFINSKLCCTGSEYKDCEFQNCDTVYVKA